MIALSFIVDDPFSLGKDLFKVEDVVFGLEIRYSMVDDVDQLNT